MLKVVLVLFTVSFSLFGAYIDSSKVDKSKLGIKLMTCESHSCFLENEKKISDDYSVVKKKDKYDLYLVNISSQEKLDELIKKYKTSFPSLSILKTKKKPLKTQDKEKIIVKAQKMQADVKPEPTLVKKEKKEVNKPVLSSKEKKEIIGDYKKALKLYKLKEYLKAYELFNVLFEKNLDNININYYLGRSAFELKKYHEAIVAFDRILFSQPDSIRAKLEIAKAFFMSRKFQDSKHYFDQLMKDPKVPAKLKQGIEKYLAVIDENTQKHFLNGVVLVGVNYDSNVNSKSTFDQYYVPSLNIDLNNTTEDSKDWAHQEVLILNHRRNISDKKTFKNDFMIFAKTMNNNKNAARDIDMISYTPTFSYIHSPKLSVDYSLFADALWLDDKSNLRTYGLMPKFTYMLDKTTITTGYVKYQIKENQQEASKVNDSKYLEISNDWKFVSKGGVSYGGALTLSRERQNKTQANNTIDKDTLELKTNSTYMLGKKVSLAPTLSYKYTKYKKDDVTYSIKRSDDEYKAALMATYIHSQKWLFQVGGDFTRTRSNIPANEYDKHTFTFNIIRPF